MSLFGGNTGADLYSARDDNQGWSSNVHLRVDGGSSKNEGQHRHQLIKLKTTWTEVTEWQPEYTAVYFIMRIN